MIDIHRADARAVTATEWLDSRHSFAFGQHYDPANTGFGSLIVNNDDWLAPGGGFASHAHRDAEIVTWVITGALAHEDDHGHRGVITPGVAQRMSAGSGVVHSERNASDELPVRFVQMWVQPDEWGTEPSYEQRVVPQALGLVPVVSGRGHDAISIRADAVLWRARFAPGDRLEIPTAPWVHVFVTQGELHLKAPLGPGDAVRLRNETGRELTAVTEGEALIWELHSPAG